MNKKKKLISFVLLFYMMVSICLPITAYAESYDDQIKEYQDSIEEIMDLVEQEDKDTAEKYQAIIDVLFSDETKRSFTDANSSNYTIKAGYAKIDEAIKAANSTMNWLERIADINVNALSNVWKSQFRKEAEAYGIEYGNTFGTKGSAAEEIENASIKVNLLTWDRDKKNNGSVIAQLEQGVVMKFLKAFDSFSGFTTWTRGIAIALTIVFGCTTIMTMTMDRNASAETLQREFIKVLFGIWVIMNYKFFALLIIRLGTIITERVMITDFNSEKGKYVYLTLCQSFSELVQEAPNISQFGIMQLQGQGGYVGSGIGNAASNFVGTISNFVGGGLTQLASSLTVYAVVIEIGLRYMFTPIAIADLYSEKFRSNGWMWLKKLFAVSMQGAVIFMIIYAVDVLKNAIDTTSIITNTAINLTMIGMFAKSRQIANDIIGVH